MRRLVPLALLALAVAPALALAQTQYADSSGGFISLHRLSLGRTFNGGERAVDAGVGYRFGSGTDASLRVVYRTGFSTTIAAGPTVGVTRPIGAGFSSRLEGSVLAAQTSAFSRVLVGDALTADPVDVRVLSLRTDVLATVTRPVRIAGSLRLHPTVGVFGRTGGEHISIDGPGRIGTAGTETRAGLHVGLPLSFRLFGQTASLDAAVRFPFGDRFRFEVPGDADLVPGGGAYAGGGFRLNF